MEQETSNIEKNPKISLIVAVTKDENAIGRKTGELLFRISGDLKRFQRLTMGKPIVMGRKTFESIGRALPGRANIVITRNSNFKAPDCLVTSSLEEALRKGGEMSEEVFVIGGGEIYRQALPYVDKLYITVVESSAKGDVFFPKEWKKVFTKEVYREERLDEKTGLKYIWLDLER